jgi:hypothetical protein
MDIPTYIYHIGDMVFVSLCLEISYVGSWSIVFIENGKKISAYRT